MDQGEVQQPTWAGRTLSLKAHAAGPWEAPKTLGAALGGKFPPLAGPRWDWGAPHSPLTPI